MKYSSPEAYQLLHDGSLALADIEHNGIRIDIPYVKKTRHQIALRCHKLEVWMKQQPEWGLWRRRYGTKANLGSGEQLATVLFTDMKYTCYTYTKKGKPKTDRAALDGIKDSKFVRKYCRWADLKNADGKFLAGIEKETVGEYLHPIFNLHFIKTFRSSSEALNFQNFPVRSDLLAELVRSAFIPRPGCRIVETDYGGIEVKVAACYHKDPTMLKYIKDPTKDMHRDMAAEIYKCQPEQVNKMLRYVAKNRFVFPEFYGSYWAQVGPDLWSAINSLNLTIEETPVGEWLGAREITTLGGGKIPPPGSFLEHIRKIDHDFWNKRFKVYGDWRKRWYNQYLETGGYQTLTGFYIRGVYKKNDVINHPVQGSAFHCLLWSLIELNREIKRRKMKTKIVGQIHDSIVADVPDKEMPQYLALVEEIMVQRIRDMWAWLIVPLSIEVEATEVNAPWYTKKAIQLHEQN